MGLDSSNYKRVFLLNGNALISAKSDTTLGAENYMIFQFYQPGNYKIELIHEDSGEKDTVISYNVREAPRTYDEFKEVIDENVKFKNHPIAICFPLKIKITETNSGATDYKVWE
jgi:hypothetical protein